MYFSSSISVHANRSPALSTPERKEIKGNENWTILIPQWILEGFVDLIGDGVLDANFKFVIKSKVSLNYEF